MSEAKLFRRPQQLADLLIRGAHTLDPRSGLDEPQDILIRKGEIAALAPPEVARGR